MSTREPLSLYQSIYHIVRGIPAGRVMTYGQIGALVGCSARTVGFAMASLGGRSDVPWQRVINRQGRVSPRRDGEGNLLQQDLLQAEGVCFDQEGRADLNRYRWEPDATTAGPG
ncbi:MAG: cysteine methyltransferase [Desulfuromonas sp.]|jgi:methylated-DNA-protein-cysteine methyltransferase-like protein|nr:MAG: cysteine methyltransferase [Desulfuromonas sp.]